MKRTLLATLLVAVLSATVACASPFILRRGGGNNGAAYPAVVVSAGLQTTWDTQATAGVPLGTSLTNFSAYSLPAGFTRSSVAGTFTGNATVSAVNLTGYTVYGTVNGTSGVLSNSLVTQPNTGQDQLLVLGQTQTGATSGPVTIDAESDTFDGTGANHTLGSVIQVDNGSTIIINNGLVQNSPRGPMISFGAATTITNSYFHKMALLAITGDHLEFVFAHKGTVLYKNSFFDMRDSTLPSATCTAPLFFKSTDGAITATVDGDMILGAAHGGCNYPIEVSTFGFTINLTVKNSILSKGTTPSQYVGPSYDGSNAITVTNGGNNWDWDSRMAITGPLCATSTGVTCN